MDTAQYFYRNSIFSKKKDTISIIDFENPKSNRQDLDPWFGTVFQLADGQHKIDEIQSMLAKKYNGTPPKNLLKTIISVVERLAASRLIVLTEKKTELPYYLSIPYEQLDIEKAKKLMAEDKNRYK